MTSHSEEHRWYHFPSLAEEEGDHNAYGQDMSGKQTILIDLLDRSLNDGEADELRAFVASLRPKVHLVMPCWRWIEVRGIGIAEAQQIAARIRSLAPRSLITGNTKPHQTTISPDSSTIRARDETPGQRCARVLPGVRL